MKRWSAICLGWGSLALASTAAAQPPVGPLPPPPPPPYSVYGQVRSFDDFDRPYRIQDFSYVFIEVPPPRVVKVHDIVTILVSEKSQVTMNSNFNRQRNGTYKAELKEFIRLGKTGNLATAAPNQPAIDANLQGRVQSTGLMNDSEGITYRIAAEVTDVQPNGILVLEARKLVRSNKESWEYTLTGRVRSEDVNRDNTAVSEDIANLNITKRTKGKVYDSTQRPWGAMLWDRIFPF